MKSLYNEPILLPWLSSGCSLLRWTRLPCRCLNVGVKRTSTTSEQASESNLARSFRLASDPQYAAVTQSATPRPLCRTAQSDPTKHNINHEGLFYTLPDAEAQLWCGKGGRPEYYKLAKAFTETTLMVRKPALEVMQYMENASYKMPVIRYLLYGAAGSGKTCTMMHVLHYCGHRGWLIVHVPWGSHWNRYFKEVQPSSHKAGRVDLPLDAAEWLSYFKTMNAPILKEQNPTIYNRYVWNKREAAEVGSTWAEAIEFGLTRVKYASDVVGLILKEIKLQALQKNMRVMVAVDGVNAFWEDMKLKREDDPHKKVHASEVSLIHNMKKLLQNDWNNGAVLCTVDDNCKPMGERTQSYMPRYLLQKQGFELFDPYIPIHVPNYSEKEMQSCLDYYTDRRWIQNPQGLTEEGRKELIFLSCHNPMELYKASQSW